MAEILFGYAADDIIGKNVNLLIPESCTSQGDGYLQYCMEKDPVHFAESGIGRELSGIHKDRGAFPVGIKISELAIP